MSVAQDTSEFGNSAVAELIRDHNWSASPLGPPDTWPQELRTVVSVVMNSKFPMFMAWGAELTFLYNDAYIDILGQKHPAALGQTFHEVWAEIWPQISPIIDRAMAGEPSYFDDLPLTMQRKGYEEQAWFTFSYSPVFDNTGEVAGMFCACTETTRQVLAERQRTSEIERLHALFHQAPGIIAVVRHANHVFELANEAYLNLVARRDIIGKPVIEALPEVQEQGFVDLLDRVFTTGEAYRGYAVPIQLQRQSGGALERRYVDFIYQPIRDLSGTVTGIFVEGSDVTEAVLANQALRDNEQRLRQLANTIPHLAWMADPNGYVHWFNDRFFQYTGTNQEQVEGWRWLDLLLADDSPVSPDEIKALFATGEAFEVRAPLRAANGEYRTFYTKVAPLHDSNGKIVQWFGTNTDIHEIQRAQEELRTANRRKDDFLAMLAHELRNPLAPISTAAELLNAPNPDQEQIRATSRIISRQVAHMTDLVDDLLDVSRVTRGLVSLQKEPVAIAEVIDGALEQVKHLAASKNHRLVTRLPAERAMVHGDRTRLVQIFSNILNNAVRYTKAGGEITVEAEVSDDNLEVRIRDNGVGIAAELLPHVFDLFTQAERSPDRALGGLGLGLTLVRSLIGLHGGTVTARSEGVDKGSEFIVTLPRLLRSDPEEKMTGQAGGAEGLQQQRILIVDDNVDAASSLSMLLHSYGYITETSFTAKDGLQAAADFQPEAIILDIGLPDMDGYALARRLRAQPSTADVFLIALTGYGQSEDRAQSEAAGFSHHLVKPANIQQLLAILSRPAAS